jgi:hypothetical protein
MHYVGSGPYCYANSLAMVLGRRAPDPSAIEVLTGAPFGVLLLDGTLPFFSPGGWNPSIGLDAALDWLGWACDRTAGGDAEEAIDRLRVATRKAPVLVGPVDIGLLLHHPGRGRAIGADHYVVVLAVEGEAVRFHDPHGYPYAILPIAQFMRAWKADLIVYADAAYAMRLNFRQIREVKLEAAIKASIPRAVHWLGNDHGGSSLVGESALTTLADQIEGGLEPRELGHLVQFAVRVGARRLADAARWLAAIGLIRASEIAENQAQLLGRVQYDLVAGDNQAAAAAIRILAPCYDDLRDALAAMKTSSTD